MTKRVIKIEDTGCDKTYYPIYYTHNAYFEGGRKTHIFNENTGKCLCGFQTVIHNIVFYEDHFKDIVGFISQPDPDKCICQRCKQILINSLEV